MAPHAEDSNGITHELATEVHEPGLSKEKADTSTLSAQVQLPQFKNKYDERTYLKGRLAAALRIFGKFGFDEYLTTRPGWIFLHN